MASPGSHVARKLFTKQFEGFDVNEHAPLTKTGKNRSLIFTYLTTVPFRAYVKSR